MYVKNAWLALEAWAFFENFLLARQYSRRTNDSHI
jgi:hypothetical protein